MASSLSMIGQWKPDNMNNAAAHLNTLAANEGSTMDAINASAAALPWTGAGKDGNAAVLVEHSATVDTHATALGVLAGLHSTAADDLSGQQQLLGETVQAVTSAGFNVADDGTVTAPNDPYGFMQGIAQGLTAQIQGQGAAFDAAHSAHAAAIQAGTAGLGVDGNGYYDNKGQWWPTYDQAWCSNQGTPWDQCWAYGTAGAKIGEGHVSMMDGWNNPPMKPVGGEPTIGSGGGETTLEHQAGRDAGANMPAMPGDWPRNIPAPSVPSCPPGQLVGDTANITFHTAMETAGVLMLPSEGPAVVPGVLGLAYGAHTIVDDSHKLIECIQRDGGIW